MSENFIENLKNNLMTKSLIESIDEILQKDKIKNSIRNFLTGLKSNQTLYSLKFPPNYEYISRFYTLAKNKLKYNEKVSRLSYGLVYLYESIYLYIKKEEEESLNYIKNYKNITPINFEQYAKSNSSKNSNKSELLLNGGMNMYGYSYEFNVDFFIRSLASLISLPNLIINIEGQYPTFKELDIAYYNKQIIQNENSSLLRTSLYCEIKDNNITFMDGKDFQIFEESLILGEVKSSFPKRINKNKIGPDDKKPSLEEIIENLFIKLGYFYDLYKEKGLIEISEMKNIQLIFFYDNVQLTNIKDSIIKDFIMNNKVHFNKIKGIQIHLFIVYTLPSISNVSLHKLNKDLQILKEKDNTRENEYIELVNKINTLIDENKERDNIIQNLRSEIQKMKLSQTPETEQKSSNVVNDRNNSNKEENKINDIDDIYGLLNNNDNINNDILNNDVFDFIDKINSNIINSNNTNNLNNINNMNNINNTKNMNDINNINNINNINISFDKNINEGKNNDLIIFDDDINSDINNNINKI